MSIYNLEKMFHPESVAIVGAGEKKGSVGFVIMQNLIKGEYSGNIYPVNPNYETIWERPACATLSDINSAIDLAVIAVPIKTVPAIIKECVGIGVSGAVIVSAWEKETETKGIELEAAIRKEAEDAGLRIIGPGSLGIINCRLKLNAGLSNHMPLPGKTAFVSQSGGIGTSILDLSIREHIGFSYFVSFGSMLDVDFGDIIDYLGGDPYVSSILLYVESFTRCRNFMSAARAVSRVKPIIALKAGRSRDGALAAYSYTSELGGEDGVYDAAFKLAGIVRVMTFEELFDCAELLAKQPRVSGHGIAVITNAGGPGEMVSDFLSDYGMEPVNLNPETISKLDEILPGHRSQSNPIDISDDASPQLYEKVVEICMNAQEVNGLLIMLAPHVMVDPAEVAQKVADLLKKRTCSVITSWVGGLDVEKGREIFKQAGIPTFDTPERAVRAFIDIYHYSRNIEMLQEIPSKLPHKLEFNRDKARILIQQGLLNESQVLTEIEANELLSAYGIPVDEKKMVCSEEEAVKYSQAMGFPVAMKICSRDILNKAEVDGIKLNLINTNQVRLSFNQIVSNVRSFNREAIVDCVTIQPMHIHKDYELVLGAIRDRSFGPVIFFGMGGIITEVIRDCSFALPPLNRLLARRLMEETKIYHLLKGYKNHPGANLILLEEILIRLAQLVTDFEQIEKIEINPLIISGIEAWAENARVWLKPSKLKAPLHLVISPYPNQYESHVAGKGFVEIFIRPIRPEDAPLLTDLFKSLSSRSVYLRFLSILKQLPHDMLVRFTQIDYDREIALVALSGKETYEKMLGVARVFIEQNKKHGEFSVITGDPWQGKGIGAELLKRCLAIAKERNVETVWGIVLAENTQMLKLGRKLGFKTKGIPGSSEYELRIDLRKTDKI